MFTPHLYHRTPHPVICWKNFVWSVTQMSDFLKVLIIRTVGQKADQAIYKILYPYCRCKLLALVTNAIKGTESFEIFHARLLEKLISARQLSQWLRSMKGCNLRGIACYLRAINYGCRIGASYLRKWSTSCWTDCGGTTPTQRARFFSGSPSTFLHFQLMVVDRNIVYPDQKITVQSTAVTVSVVESPRVLEF